MRIAVIGAGMVGLASALWLLRDGHEVVLVDRVEPGDPGQTSYGNAGLLTPAGVVPIPRPGLTRKAPGMLLNKDGPLFLRLGYLPRLAPWLMRWIASGRRVEAERISGVLSSLVSDTVAQHRALAEGTEAAPMIKDSRWIHLFPTRAAAMKDKDALEMRRRAGLVPEELDRAALLALDPHIGPHYQHALAWPGGGHLETPPDYMRALGRAVAAAGGEIRRAEVTGLTQNGEGVRIDTSAGPLTADRAVLAAGAWSGTLMRALGHDPGLESERGYHIMLDGPTRMPPEPYMLSDAASAATPMAGRLRVAGTVELGGLKAGPSAGPTALQRRALRRLYPDIEFEREEVWMGHRPTTIDSLPLLGPCPKAPGVIAAFGCQHLGITMGAKLGRLVADGVAGRLSNLDLDALAPDRFDRR